jgi:hypothetical protein
MILIYSDSQLIDTEWLQFLQFPDDHTVIKEFSTYCAAQSDFKLAFTSHRLHCDEGPNCTAYQGFEDKILQLSAASDLVFSFESELHNYHWTIWGLCHRPNVYWCQPGAVNDRNDINIIFWGDWFKTTCNLYQALPQVLDQLYPHQPKPRYFDALLGTPKPHRTFVADAIKQQGLQDQIVLTYGESCSNDEFYARDYFIWEPGCEPETQITGTADHVRYHGRRCHLSQVIPTAVYNNTAYSIVAETDHDNTLSFFTEKTAKAFIARRLFVAFSGYRFLHNLRQLGFQTFDGIIDESYDLILNNQQRYQSAFEQVKWLCNQPQQEILEKIRPIVQHNHDLIMQTDWTQFARDRIQQVIDQSWSSAD